MFKKQTSPKANPEVRYTNAQMKADEFVKTKQSFGAIGAGSNAFKLKRFQGIESKIDNKR